MADSIDILPFLEDSKRPVNETVKDFAFDSPANITQGIQCLVLTVGQPTFASAQFEANVGGTSQTPVSNGVQNTIALILILTE